jgi:hypothetical protein
MRNDFRELSSNIDPLTASKLKAHSCGEPGTRPLPAFEKAGLKAGQFVINRLLDALDLFS